MWENQIITSKILTGPRYDQVTNISKNKFEKYETCLYCQRLLTSYSTPPIHLPSPDCLDASLARQPTSSKEIFCCTTVSMQPPDGQSMSLSRPSYNRFNPQLASTSTTSLCLRFTILKACFCLSFLTSRFNLYYNNSPPWL